MHVAPTVYLLRSWQWFVRVETRLKAFSLTEGVLVPIQQCQMALFVGENAVEGSQRPNPIHGDIDTTAQKNIFMSSLLTIIIYS